MQTETQTETQAPGVSTLPLKDIGLSTHPNRQIRPLKPEGVRRLVEESDPATWDAIVVRAWPESDPYPVGEEGRAWQVIAGYHRVTAARQLGRATIKAEIVADVPDDAAFLLLALTSNLRHGEQMTREEKVAVLRALHNPPANLSYSEIERRTGIRAKTAQNWLSGRDTNVGRLPRNAAGGRQGGVEMVDNVADDLIADAGDTQRRIVVDTLLNKALTAGEQVVLGVSPADAQAWWSTITPSIRAVERERVRRLAQYWTRLADLGATQTSTATSGATSKATSTAEGVRHG